MNNFWSLFIIAGTLGSLGWALWLLLANRTKQSGAPQTMDHDFDGIREYDNPLPAWWVGLFVVTIVFAAAYLVYYPGLGSFAGLGKWTSREQWQNDVAANEARLAPLLAGFASMSEAQLHESHQAQQMGRRLFVNYCANCHGTSARGGAGFPNLTDDEWMWGAGYDAVKTTVRGGRTAAMPAWGAVLGDAGTADMVQYVLRLSAAAHDDAAAQRAAPQFETLCATCHGPDGKGNPLFGAPDLTNDVWLYGGDADSLATTLKNGRNGQMPAFTTVLGDARADLVAAYVTGLKRQ
jgi:cytochrome c oxidase cbb3-type subunit 3